MQKNIKFWDKAAEKYAKSPIADLASYNYTLERTRSHLKPGHQVLEIGCGTGSTALLLADRVAHITATDIAPAMVQIGKRKAAAEGVSNVTFVADDSLSATLPSKQFDAVLAFNLLHLLENPAATMARIHWLLKPGGLFISKTVCRPENGFPFKFMAMMAILPLMQFLGKAPFVNITKIRELEQTVTDQGFMIIETGNHPAQPPSRYIVARKI